MQRGEEGNMGPDWTWEAKYKVSPPRGYDFTQLAAKSIANRGFAYRSKPMTSRRAGYFCITGCSSACNSPSFHKQIYVCCCHVLLFSQ